MRFLFKLKSSFLLFVWGRIKRRIISGRPAFPKYVPFLNVLCNFLHAALWHYSRDEGIVNTLKLIMFVHTFLNISLRWCAESMNVMARFRVSFSNRKQNILHNCTFDLCRIFTLSVSSNFEKCHFFTYLGWQLLLVFSNHL